MKIQLGEILTRDDIDRLKRDFGWSFKTIVEAYKKVYGKGNKRFVWNPKTGVVETDIYTV